MHYGAWAFTSNGSQTITPLQSTTIGQRNGLSALDIASVYENYPIWPVAHAQLSTTSSFLGSPILFDAQQSYDPNGDNLQYVWQLGDGNSNVTDVSFEHTYADIGNYDVSLTITDDEGYQDVVNTQVSVYGIEVILPLFALLN